MPRNIPRVLWICLPLVYLSYFYHLNAVGMLGPDEPRYASIARAMARSGDWITPRLDGQPWFQKPPLLYWMSAAAFRAGLGPDAAPRLPVALLAVAFLVFYWWLLHSEFGSRVAWFSVLMLGGSVGWMAVSQVGVTDLPVTATFSAAMLLTLPWVGKQDPRYLPAAAVLMGCAVLAKSGVPIVLAVPILWWGWWRTRPARLPYLKVLGAFLLVALPWHVVCYLRNGSIFPYTLFVQHQLQRFTTDALQHTQPVWFYLPIFIGLIAPWSPLLGLLFRRTLYRDPRTQFLLAWVVCGLIFFSLSSNKLPAYVLPLVPAVVVLIAIALDQSDKGRYLLVTCAVLLIALPIGAAVLPAAVANGLSRAPRPAFQWMWLLPAAIAVAVWILDSRFRRVAAIAAIAAGAAAGMVYVKQTAASELDRLASARTISGEIAGRADQVCVESLKRDLRYGLDYYLEVPLPDCAAQPRPSHVMQLPGGPPTVR